MLCVCCSLRTQAILYYTFGALGGDPLAQMTMVCVGGVSVGVWCVYMYVCLSVSPIQGYRYLSGVNVEQSCESALAYYSRVALSGE